MLDVVPRAASRTWKVLRRSFHLFVRCFGQPKACAHCDAKIIAMGAEVHLRC